MTRIRFVTVSAFVWVALGSSCARLSDRHATTPANGDTMAERHWIQGAKLRHLMATIGQKTSSTWPQEVEKEYAIKDRSTVDLALDDAQELAVALATSAASIPESIVAIKLPEADRRGFNAHAATLVDQANRLSDAAISRDVTRMQHELQSIRATCQSCHERYRDVSGPLEP